MLGAYSQPFVNVLEIVYLMVRFSDQKANAEPPETRFCFGFGNQVVQ